jgi:hypothetical protein
MAIAPDMYITGRYADGKAKARHEKIVMADHGCSCIRLTLIRRADQVDMWEAFQYSFPTKLLTKTHRPKVFFFFRGHTWHAFSFLVFTFVERQGCSRRQSSL